MAQVVRQKFKDVTTEQEFFAVLQDEIAQGHVPKLLMPAFQDFYNNYKTAVLGSGVPGADEALVAKIMSAIADRSVHEFVEPYTFPSFHHRILEPYNYYQFGQNYVRTLLDFSKSVVGHLARFDEIEQQIAAGENVVLLANHQTEADPGVFALLLEHTHPRLATDVIYVAGDRVVTDPLCKPFSMGRNLFCVHSKKRLDDIPELKASKVATNRRTLSAMTKALNEGGRLLWIAPSGGRDRPQADTGAWHPDKFDPTAVELMRQLLSRSAPKGHLYPFAMYSWELMPPPKGVEKGLGERRLTHFAGTGISVCKELDVDSIVSSAAVEDKATRQQLLATAAWQAVSDEYAILEEVIGSEDARRQRSDVYQQPWAQ
uniref:Glycerol-3-phosphate acyltransferase, chloroplastic n=1 Tax=Lobosphaera incisa TaxID=312850 RepID=UPI002ED70977